MKKIIFHFSFLFFLFASFQIQAQEVSGVATYKSKTSVDLDSFGGPKMTDQMKKQILERMKTMLEKTYTLTFNSEESIYTEEEKLAPEGGFGAMMGGVFSQGATYKNVKKNQILQKNELMGKRFLVKDSLENFEWKLEKESKMIGQYAAFKATLERKSQDMWKRVGKKAKEWREKNASEEELDSTALAKQEKMLEDMQNVTVWYTPQIPVKQGPDVYHGLPGLILEINVGNTTILCSKVVLNPKEEVEIDKPEKGEVVTREEFAKITEKKTQEMMERYGRGRGRGGRGGF